MQEVLEKQLRRSLGAATLTAALAETLHPDPAVLGVGGHHIQIQLLSSVGYPAPPLAISTTSGRWPRPGLSTGKQLRWGTNASLKPRRLKPQPRFAKPFAGSTDLS
jgi:hypothetical protein